MRDGMTDATIAAKAAKESADTAKIQAEVSRGTLKSMQDTAARQLRAYVSVTQVEVTVVSSAMGGGVEITPRVILKNSGQTPAVLMGVSIETAVGGAAGGGGGNINPHYREITPGDELETEKMIGTGIDVFALVENGQRRYGMVNTIVRFRYRDYLDNEWRRNVEFRGPIKFRTGRSTTTAKLELLGSVPDNGIWDEPPHPETRNYIG
jgi:hypothetical protein